MLSRDAFFCLLIHFESGSKMFFSRLSRENQSYASCDHIKLPRTSSLLPTSPTELNPQNSEIRSRMVHNQGSQDEKSITL